MGFFSRALFRHGRGDSSAAVSARVFHSTDEPLFTDSRSTEVRRDKPSSMEIRNCCGNNRNFICWAIPPSRVPRVRKTFRNGSHRAFHGRGRLAKPSAKCGRAREPTPTRGASERIWEKTLVAHPPGRERLSPVYSRPKKTRLLGPWRTSHPRDSEDEVEPSN